MKILITVINNSSAIRQVLRSNDPSTIDQDLIGLSGWFIWFPIFQFWIPMSLLSNF